MEHVGRKKMTAILSNITLNLWILLCFISGNGVLHSVPIHEDWNVYQKEVLKEKPNFPGWCPDDKAKHIMDLILSDNSEICVELGIFGGSSFFPLASALAFKKQGIAYAVDPWTNEACLEGYEETNDDHYKYWGKVKLDKIMNIFIEGMHKNGLDTIYKIMRMTSAQAYVHFENESIDFIHIDGNHSEQSAIFDVEHWLPKVKKGGIICFDDAWWESTQPAIKILLTQCDIMEESSPKWQYIFLRKR
jgi:predicted O-methyltransferase YrrM